MSDSMNGEIKYIIAQNCMEYKTKDDALIMSLSNIAQNCNNCLNFKCGKCKKGLFNKIKNLVEVN